MQTLIIIVILILILILFKYIKSCFCRHSFQRIKSGTIVNSDGATIGDFNKYSCKLCGKNIVKKKYREPLITS